MYNMKLLLLLAFAVSVSCRLTFDSVFENEWKLFKLQHSKVYKNAIEEATRKKIFYKNKEDILKHNELYELGQVSFTLGVNKYSDLDYDEFTATMTGYLNETNESYVLSEGMTYIAPDIDVPSSFDWRDKGAVTKVKDQGQCGSCWAFSTTGALEAQQFLKTKKLVPLSEQNLVDCTRKYRNNGCNGGWMGYALQYIIDNKGIDTDASYPYEARDGNCRFNPRNVGATVRQKVDIPRGDEKALEKAIATYGPVSVTIDASLQSFRSYRRGVYYDRACGRKLTHAVLAVGYGTTRSGQAYWIVKNSWGTSWGDKGYILMARNRGNNCAIATQAIFPLI